MKLSVCFPHNPLALVFSKSCLADGDGIYPDLIILFLFSNAECSLLTHCTAESHA